MAGLRQVEVSPESRPAYPTTSGASLEARVHATVELLAGRGYALTPERLGDVLYGGPASVDQVRRAVAGSPRLRLESGLVVGGGIDVATALRRQRSHAVDQAAPAATAERYLVTLRRVCPWLKSALVAGSLASQGFERGDDIDFNLVVEDGTKYLSYVVALAAALPVSWRHRRERERDTPLLPKLVCINVVWEERQMRPFTRTDAKLALEILLSRPLVGGQAVRDVAAANPALVAHFPQLEAMPLPAEDEVPLAWPGRALRAATRWRPARRTLDGACYRLAWGLHAWVRWHRRRNPAARQHVEDMEHHKHPYGILERP
ncbi:MAG: hypothetical protein ACYDBQ_06200 [Thermoplasmatota archaeon]